MRWNGYIYPVSVHVPLLLIRRIHLASRIDKKKFGAAYVNDGVQGGSPQFYNTYRFFEEVGFRSTEVDMQISFGKGEKFWTNVFPSELVAKHAKDIRKFGRVLKIIKMLEPVFAVISVQAMLSLFRFPKDFGNRLIYPLIALFMVRSYSFKVVENLLIVLRRALATRLRTSLQLFSNVSSLIQACVSSNTRLTHF